MVLVQGEVEVTSKVHKSSKQTQKFRKSLVLSERDLDKFETILTTRQHRKKDSKFAGKNVRNSSLDDSYLTFIANNRINQPNRVIQHSNSISAYLNDQVACPYEDNKLIQFSDIKNNLKISSSSSESNLAVVGKM